MTFTDLLIESVKARGGRHIADAAVRPLRVVVVHKLLHGLLGLFRASELFPAEASSVLHCFENRFNVGVVVAHSGAAVRKLASSSKNRTPNPKFPWVNPALRGMHREP